MLFKLAVLSLSDSCSKGERDDETGKFIIDFMKENDYEVIEYTILPDEKEMIEEELKRLCDEQDVDLIITTGGTGFEPRDVTPEATKSVCTRMAGGLSHALRAYLLTKFKKAMFDRGVSGVYNDTFIINLPGDLEMAKEGINFIIDALPYGLGMLKGIEIEYEE